MTKFFAWSNCIGIDPGLTGAIAQWDGEYLTLLEIPTFKSKGRGREVDWTSSEVLERMITELDLINVGRPKRVSARTRNQINIRAIQERQELLSE